MGKFFASVVAITPLETRTKKDNTGTYEYADLSLQLFDADGKPSVHERFDAYTGTRLEPQADILRFDCVRERAQALAAEKYQVGETVVVNISMRLNQYGRNEVSILNVQHYQPQQAPQPQPSYNSYNR